MGYFSPKTKLLLTSTSRKTSNRRGGGQTDSKECGRTQETLGSREWGFFTDIPPFFLE